MLLKAGTLTPTRIFFALFITSCEPCEKLSRAMFIPALIISCSVCTERDAGPAMEMMHVTSGIWLLAAQGTGANQYISQSPTNTTYPRTKPGDCDQADKAPLSFTVSHPILRTLTRK